MGRRATGGAALGLAAVATALATAATGPGPFPGNRAGAGTSDPARRLFSLADDRITEASGLAASRRQPGVLYTHNDSGDVGRFFAVGPDGRTRATFQLAGVRAVDWEDLALAPDARGVASVWLADIGDNRAQRPAVTVYRVDEPEVARGDATLPADAYRLRYPDGAHDAEALLVAPGGRLVVATKTYTGSSAVYATPDPPGPGREQLLRRVADLRFALTGSSGGPSVVGQLAVTGGDLSADGSQVVLRTYTDAYLWPVPAADVTAAFAGPPRRVALPPQRLGEAVTFSPDGSALLVTSEGVGAAVYAVPLSAPAPSTAAPRTPPSSSAASAAAVPVVERGRGADRRWPLRVALLVALASAGGLVALAWRRLR